MHPNQRHEYLAAKIRTASSAQLHLMLLEGGLRFLDQADKALLREEEVAANAALVRVMEIVEELIVGVRHSEDDLNQKLTQLYQFVFSQVCMAYTNGDRVLLQDARKILEFQRDTWRQACDKVAQDSPAKKPAMPAPHLGGAPVSGGITLDA